MVQLVPHKLACLTHRKQRAAGKSTMHFLVVPIEANRQLNGMSETSRRWSLRGAGLMQSLRHKIGRSGPDATAAPLTDRMEKATQVVKDAMGTSGGNNALLAKNIRERYDRCSPPPFALLTQDSRNCCLSSLSTSISAVKLHDSVMHLEHCPSLSQSSRCEADACTSLSFSLHAFVCSRRKWKAVDT
jgi:hypothetical protein